MNTLLRLLLLFLVSLPAFSATPAPDEVVRSVTDDVMQAVQKSDELKAGEREAVIALLEQKVLPHVDFREATRLALGRDWRLATAEQRDQLVKQFQTLLLRIYTSSIGHYHGQTMQVQHLKVPAGADDVTVRNRYLSPGHPPVSVDYAMHLTPQGWKIYDVIVDGVSIVLAFRSEFAQVVRQSGIDGLLARLEEKNQPARP
ncbi:MAG TPA: ABC transporter substrate-binding protein [Burkholderiales bacterium]|nr:ABC transporter substrate-binding protein [Burkholderiales bacterium]